MLHVSVSLDEESTFTGYITLYINQGGVRTAVKSETNNKTLNIIKMDTGKPINSIFDRPTST
jgi:hypothetical protein